MTKSALELLNFFAYEQSLDKGETTFTLDDFELDTIVYALEETYEKETTEVD